MIALMIAAAALSAAAAVLIVQRARAAVGKAPAEDPTLAVYRRQLKELDDLADHDLLPANERKSARAEAARRLLSAADETTSPLEGRGGLGLVIAVAIAAPLTAVLLYLLIGSPQIPDQPFKARLAAWRSSDPATLDPAQMAAVLQAIIAERPSDPVPLAFLGRVEMAQGDIPSAVYDFKKAIKLAPNRADLWSALGEALGAGGDVGAQGEAHAAFARANALDPKAPGPRYFLAREQIAAGQVQPGLAAWKALAVDLQPNDPRRAELADDIARVQAGGAQAVQPPAAVQGGGDQGAMIRAMVQRLADQLAARPDDPQGWGRLIRAYGVLGDEGRRTAALARAQALFKDRPGAWAAVEQAAGGPS